MVMGLAALLFQGRAVSPSFGPCSAGNACRRCLASRHRHHTSALTPPWSIASRWRAMRACKDSTEEQPKVKTARRVSGPYMHDVRVRDSVQRQHLHNCKLQYL